MLIRKTDYEDLKEKAKSYEKYYEDYWKERERNLNLDVENEELKEKITTLEKQLHDQLEVNQKYIRDIQTAEGVKNTVQESYKRVVTQLDAEIKLNAEYVRNDEEKTSIISDIESTLAAVCEDKVNENIELFAVKTYRGWKCLYHNGDKIDTGGASDISITWSDGDYVDLTVDRRK